MPGQNLELIIEKLAARVHQSWMDHRRAEGWAYGKQRDDLLKQTPCMVDYEGLPENEKETDRKTVRVVVQALLELGYELAFTGHGTSAETPAPLLADIRQRLAARGPATLESFTATWKLCLSLPHCPADICFELGRRILKLGEPVLAYDVLSRGRDTLEGTAGHSDAAEELLVRLKQQLSLSLAQCGAAERARGCLAQLCEAGHDTPETLGLLGRVYKDLATKALDRSQRQEWLEAAFQSYRRGFEKGDASFRATNAPKDADDAYYCGINAAATSVLCGDPPRARTIASRVQEICQAEMERAGANYWLVATLGEAELISGKLQSAARWYQQAVEMAVAEGDWRGLAATRKQARLLASVLEAGAFDLNAIFPSTSVIVFGSRPSAGEPGGPMADWAVQLRQAFDRRLQARGAVAGYLIGMSPADLILAEALLDSGRVAHLVLPYSRSLCRQAFHQDWQGRFDQILSRATSVTDDAQRNPHNDGVNTHFAALRAYGSGWLRAQRLDSTLLLWGLESAPGQTAQDGKSSLIQHWKKLGCHWEDLAVSLGGANPGGGEPAPSPEAAGPPETTSYGIRAMLFADVRGYSQLEDPGLFRFAQVFMARVAQMLDGFAGRILSRRTAGDGIFLVFADPGAAAETAFALRNLVAQTNWEPLGLPSHLGIRISLDAGPVYSFDDPVVHRPEVCGAFVNRAARVEPVTPPNEVYASETFSALYVAGGGTRFRFDYVGQTQLPKGFGLTPLYCLAQAEP